MRALRIAGFLGILFTLPLYARLTPTISSISPTSAPVSNGEWFLTVSGTNYLPSSGLTVNFSGPGGVFAVSANSANDSVLQAWVPTGVLLSPGNYNVTVAVPDGFGGTLTSNAAVFTSRGYPLRIIVPSYILAEAVNLDGGYARFDVSAVSDVSPNVTWQCDHNSGDFFPFTTTGVTCSASDDMGNATRTGFKVQVADTTPPTLKTPGDMNVFGSADGSYVKYDVPASDTVDTTVTTADCTPLSGSFFKIGTTTVTCTAADRYKNGSTATFRVHVGSDQYPALTVPDSVTVEAASLEGQYARYAVSAVDIKGNAVDVKCDPPSGSLFPLGTTTVSCAAYGGLNATASFPVNVVDTTPPALALPADMTVQASTIDGEYVKFSATASDSVSGAVGVTCTPASGSLFAPGTTVVNCYAYDKYRNKGTGSFNVIVQPWVDPTDYATAPSKD
jgi:HYR domain